jgi:cyclomaltodextrinase
VRLAYQPTNPSVRQVSIAGSFNNWDPVSMPLQKQNGVWATVLVLPPGTYEYMFVENEEHWITDPLAVNKRDDGFGGVNAVLDVER